MRALKSILRSRKVRAFGTHSRILLGEDYAPAFTCCANRCVGGGDTMSVAQRETSKDRQSVDGNGQDDEREQRKYTERV